MSQVLSIRNPAYPVSTLAYETKNPLHFVHDIANIFEISPFGYIQRLERIIFNSNSNFELNFVQGLTLL